MVTVQALLLLRLEGWKRNLLVILYLDDTKPAFTPWTPKNRH